MTFKSEREKKKEIARLKGIFNRICKGKKRWIESRLNKKFELVLRDSVGPNTYFTCFRGYYSVVEKSFLWFSLSSKLYVNVSYSFDFKDDEFVLPLLDFSIDRNIPEDEEEKVFNFIISLLSELKPALGINKGEVSINNNRKKFDEWVHKMRVSYPIQRKFLRDMVGW